MADTFHLFPKLPVGLQLMVWQHYRQDRPTIRHYFRLSRRGRYHTAYNTQTLHYERATARAGTDAQHDPMDPTMTKIRFTGHVRSVPENWHPDPEVARRRRRSAVNMALGWGGRFGAHPRSVTTTHAWVHFADDIFVFENRGYYHSGKLRFLASGIHHGVPQPPAAGSWPARIRTLALYQYVAYLTPSDHAILRLMDGLRTLLLVYEVPTCMRPDQLERVEVAGYVDVEHNFEYHGGFTSFHHASCHQHFQNPRKGVEMMEELLQSLGKGAVKVKAVYDCRQ